jgi:tRNA 2-thiouridine synthesizing protein A
VLKVARRMASHPPGTRFVVLATDPLAAVDVPHFCNEKGHRLLADSRTGTELRFEIEKGGG